MSNRDNPLCECGHRYLSHTRHNPCYYTNDSFTPEPCEKCKCWTFFKEDRRKKKKIFSFEELIKSRVLKKGQIWKALNVDKNDSNRGCFVYFHVNDSKIYDKGIEPKICSKCKQKVKSGRVIGVNGQWQGDKDWSPPYCECGEEEKDQIACIFEKEGPFELILTNGVELYNAKYSIKAIKARAKAKEKLNAKESLENNKNKSKK